MSSNERQNLTSDTKAAQAEDLLRREAAQRVSNSSLRTSPPTLEATLADISAEVMVEALERLQRQTRSQARNQLV